MHRGFWVLSLFVICSLQLFSGEYLPHLKKCKGPIDIVYTWVDGQDPHWQEARVDAVQHYNLATTCDAKAKSRFNNRDELKYSLRSIHAFAKFVNHIYIVTFGQRPKWLKRHPMITIIDHKEIFKNKHDLPTFNSQAIESNLHHIPNLSECYIYFNDDVLLGSKVRKLDFFTANGTPKVFIDSWDSPKGDFEEADIGFHASWKNSNRFLNQLFKKERRRALSHAPFAFRKSELTALERLLQPIFADVSSHKFRSPDDFLITAGFSQYFFLYEKHARNSKIENDVVSFSDDLAENMKGFEQIKTKKPKTYCVQDVTQGDSEALRVQLQEFFQSYYPNSAPWEME